MPDIPVLPASIDKALENVSDKPTKAMGQTFAELWQLVLGGKVSFAAEKQRLRYAQALEEYRKSLEEKVDNIPEDKQMEPSIQIAAQALDDSQYCIESEELREIFANLIARSMHADYAELIHPSFSKIAQQLSPLDARMLILFHQYRSKSGIAIANYIGRKKTGGLSPIFETVPEIMPANCSISQVFRSIISLQRLGLIETRFDVHIKTPGRYDLFENIPLYENAKQIANDWDCLLELKYGVSRLTLLGFDFVRACLD